METIAHPGVAFSNYTKEYPRPPDVPSSIEVPKFFDQVYGSVYRGSVRGFLGNHGERLITPEEAASIGSFDDNQHETIFVTIASYRDPECPQTIEEIFGQAKYPSRIRVAVVDQTEEGDVVCNKPKIPCSKDSTQLLCIYKEHIDYFPMKASYGIGPVFARHIGYRHYRGEYFAMQVDAHIRMIRHWDDDIIQQWKSANNEMAVLSTYVSNIVGHIDVTTHLAISENRPIMCNSEWDNKNSEYRHLRHRQEPEGPPGIHGEPTLHPFWAAGFSFSRGHFIVQVPYDQHLPMIFQGEEHNIGVRGFTYGYDYYSPERGVCYHHYVEAGEARKKMPKFWENEDKYPDAEVKAMKRLNSIIHSEIYPEREWPTEDREKYGIGSVRTPEKYYKTFGIYVDGSHAIERHLCRFVGKPMMKIFKPALRDNRMGLDYEKINYQYVDQWKNEKDDDGDD